MGSALLGSLRWDLQIGTQKPRASEPLERSGGERLIELVLKFTLKPSSSGSSPAPKGEHPKVPHQQGNLRRVRRREKLFTGDKYPGAHLSITQRTKAFACLVVVFPSIRG